MRNRSKEQSGEQDIEVPFFPNVLLAEASLAIAAIGLLVIGPNIAIVPPPVFVDCFALGLVVTCGPFCATAFDIPTPFRIGYYVMGVRSLLPRHIVPLS